MTDDAPFLRTILDQPHEIGPRLVFADWLEERGDPWGELIRLQCELASGDMAADYEAAHARHRKGDLCLFAGSTSRVIERCGQLLDTLTPMIIKRMVNCHYGQGIAVMNRWQAIDGDLIWWRESVWDGADPVRLFFWRGMPERALLPYSQWCDWHAEYMGAFPLWYVQLARLGRDDQHGFSETALRLVTQYAGRLTTLDVPGWMPTNAFTAWTCNQLDTIGEKCHAVTGQPFTLKIGQAMMSGPPHSAAERWQAYCDRWLRGSNVRIVSRLEARPIGPAMPGGVTLTTPPR